MSHLLPSNATTQAYTRTGGKEEWKLQHGAQGLELASAASAAYVTKCVAMSRGSSGIVGPSRRDYRVSDVDDFFDDPKADWRNDSLRLD